VTRRRSYPPPIKPGTRVPSMFVLLDEASKRASVLKLASAGMGDHGISQMTGMSIADVRRIIAERAIELARETLR
jgi:hypothetical protein